jgi:hypothetical protein
MVGRDQYRPREPFCVEHREGRWRLPSFLQIKLRMVVANLEIGGMPGCVTYICQWVYQVNISGLLPALTAPFTLFRLSREFMIGLV